MSATVISLPLSNGLLVKLTLVERKMFGVLYSDALKLFVYPLRTFFASFPENYQSGRLYLIFLEGFAGFGGPGLCLLFFST